MPSQNSTTQDLDFTVERRTMVDRQVRTFDVTDQLVIARMLEVPREMFAPPDLASIAYSDKALTVWQGAGERRVLLPPLILARMLQAAGVERTDKALDLAGGGGYGAAVLAGMARSVTALESIEELTGRAQRGFAALGLSNARAITGSLANAAGLKETFDVIIVNGGVETGLAALFELLADGGRLIAVERNGGDQGALAGQAVRWRKTREDVGCKPLFNAAAPVLKDFARKPEFAF